MFDWGFEWVALLCLMAFAISGRVGRRTHFSIGLFLLTVLVPGIVLTFWAGSVYQSLPGLEPIFVASQMRGALACVLLFLPLFWLPKKAWNFLLVFFCLLNSLLMVGEWLAGVAPPLGLTGSAAVSASMGAVCLPFLWRHTFLPWPRSQALRWAVRVLPVFACLISRSSLAYGVLGVVLGVQMLYSRWWWTALAALPWSLWAGHLLQHRDLFTTRGRTELWSLYLQYAKDHFNWAYGSGLGSTPYHLPTALVNWTYKDQGTCVWVHNDWLQVLTEQGLVGFTCLCVMFGYTVWKARKRAGLQAALWGFGAASCGSFLPHGALSAAIGIGLLVVTWSGHEEADRML